MIFTFGTFIIRDNREKVKKNLFPFHKNKKYLSVVGMRVEVLCIGERSACKKF